MTKFIQKFHKHIQKNLDFSSIIVFLISIQFFITTLIVDYKHLPLGWEIPKIRFWIYSSFILLLFIILAKLDLILINIRKNVKSIKNIKIGLPKITHKRLSLILLTSIVISMFITLINTKYFIYFNQLAYVDFYTNILEILSGYSDFINIGITGSLFREQGLLFYLSTIFIGLLLYSYTNPKNLSIVSNMLIFSGFIQSIIGIYQFININYILQNFSSDYIFGTFGQNNFFSGFILVTTLVTLFQTNTKNKKTYKNLIIVTLFYIQLITLFISNSLWGIVTFLSVVCLYFISKNNKKNIFIIFEISLISFFIFFIPTSNFFIKLFPVYQQRLDLWTEIFKLYTVNVFNNTLSFVDILFGTGFDTISNTLKNNGIFTNLHFDRAHNIFLDILIQTGMVSLFLISTLITNLYLSFKKIRLSLNSEDYNQISSVGLIIIALILRAIIHTNSVINIVELIFALFIFAKLIHTNRNFLRS